MQFARLPSDFFNPSNWNNLSPDDRMEALLVKLAVSVKSLYNPSATPEEKQLPFWHSLLGEARVVLVDTLPDALACLAKKEEGNDGMEEGSNSRKGSKETGQDSPQQSQQFSPPPRYTEEYLNGRKYYLIVERKFLKTCKPMELVFVAFHELLHLLLKHIERTNGRDEHVFNIAADAIVNATLLLNGLKIPEGCVGNGVGRMEVEDDTVTFTLKAVTVKPLEHTVEELYRLLEEEAKKVSAPRRHCEIIVPGDPEDIEKVRRELITSATTFAAKHQGTIPLGAERLLNILKTPVPPDALSALMEFFSTASTGTRHLDWNRAYRFAPRNLIVPDMCGGKKVKAAVVIDTSGSMSDEELEKVYGMIADLMSRVSQVELEIMWCDASLYLENGRPVKVTSLSSLIEAAEKTRGGGGTDFRPAFRWLEENGVEKVVFVTDGYATLPRKTSVDVLWLLTPEGMDRMPFGKCVKLRW